MVLIVFASNFTDTTAAALHKIHSLGIIHSLERVCTNSVCTEEKFVV